MGPEKLIKTHPFPWKIIPLFLSGWCLLSSPRAILMIPVETTMVTD